jgi:hypothetical protein
MEWSAEIHNTLRQAHLFCDEKGFSLLAVKPYSLHHEDSHLAIVLIDRKRFAFQEFPTDRYVTWLFNSAWFAFNDGSYYSNIKQAIKSFARRGIDISKL